ncbi:prepilin-type N-cleavage/methylation domain protein [Clostridium sp. CAG:628]|jgi:prepilin-type N-terminal cleavage/methylation domain-containing protein|nr:prepilin-type N-cleavage/methylation domain protein [Clostridium sp. CAG:628]
MKKKGFTLVELIAVIALLSIVMLLIVPNVANYLNSSKKTLFYDNVVNMFKSATTTFMYQDDPTNTTFSNNGVKLDVDVESEYVYTIKVNNYGEVISIDVNNGVYSYNKSSSDINEGLNKSDIKLEDVKDM